MSRNTSRNTFLNTSIHIFCYTSQHTSHHFLFIRREILSSGESLTRSEWRSKGAECIQCIQCIPLNPGYASVCAERRRAAFPRSGSHTGSTAHQLLPAVTKIHTTHNFANSFFILNLKSKDISVECKEGISSNGWTKAIWGNEVQGQRLRQRL